MIAVHVQNKVERRPLLRQADVWLRLQMQNGLAPGRIVTP